MSDEEFVDPYVYPGTTVLRNLLNETDAAARDRAEYELTFLRREELARHPLTGPFTLPRLQETHRRLFQDVYRWAGEIRTVEIRKGSSHTFPGRRVVSVDVRPLFDRGGGIHRIMQQQPRV